MSGGTDVPSVRTTDITTAHRQKISPDARAPGGYRPGAGRPPKPHNPGLLTRAYALLDEATLPAIQAIVALLTDGKPSVRLDAAKLILAKTIPDIKPDVSLDPKQSDALVQSMITLLLDRLPDPTMRVGVARALQQMADEMVAAQDQPAA